MAEFLVQADGTRPIEYQWQNSTDGGQTWNDIPGATTAFYDAPDDLGILYRAIVTNDCGQEISDVVQVIESSPPP